MEESSSVVVEDIDTSIFVPRSCESSVNRLHRNSVVDSSVRRLGAHKINAHAKASFRLEFPYFGSICKIVPHIDSPIKGCSSKILSVIRKSYCPYFPSFVPICVKCKSS